MQSIDYRSSLALSVVVGLAAAALGVASAQTGRTSWFRGNTHSHTNKAAPDVVARWYREHHYHFVVLTDVNRRTPVDGLNAVLGAPGRFLVLEGIELSQENDEKVVDVNGIGLVGKIALPTGDTVVEMLNSSAKAVRDAGGIPIIDHPNLTWALTDADIAAATELRHFEVWNAEPGMHNRGAGGSPLGVALSCRRCGDCSPCGAKTRGAVRGLPAREGFFGRAR